MKVAERCNTSRYHRQ